MKTSSVAGAISVALLRFVRDARPTEAELLAWLGSGQHGRYHTLRKAGLLLVQGGVVVASPQHLTADGKHLHFENLRYNIDEDTIDILQIGSRRRQR
jgi:hypothetical protein